VKSILYYVGFLVGEIADKAVRRSVFLTIWHCVLSAELTKNALLQTVLFWRFCPLGFVVNNFVSSLVSIQSLPMHIVMYLLVLKNPIENYNFCFFFNC